VGGAKKFDSSSTAVARARISRRLATGIAVDGVATSDSLAKFAYIRLFLHQTA
jgi:hypothetical protein